MIRKGKYIYLLLLLFLCSNRCAQEVTYIHVFNNDDKKVIVLSKNELQDYRDNFLSKDLIDGRTTNANDDRGIGFDEFKLNEFEDKKGNYIFYFIPLENQKASQQKQDSIIIGKNSVSLLQLENQIVYKKHAITFSNKN